MLPQIPFNAQGRPAAGHGSVAPGRDIYRVHRKRLPDGRILEFIYQLSTQVTAGMTYVTVELLESPVLDCSCHSSGPDDAMLCSRCSRVVCARRHAFTCMTCGQVFCSSCMQGLVVDGTGVVVCRPCAEELSDSALRKAWKGLKRMIWGMR